MEKAQMLMFIIKLVLGGAAAFTAILLWSRNGDAAWICIICAVLVSYAGTVYSFLVELGVLVYDRLQFFSMPLTSLVFSALPPVLFTASFVMMLLRDRFKD